jgi:hypothetical protein
MLERRASASTSVSPDNSGPDAWCGIGSASFPEEDWAGWRRSFRRHIRYVRLQAWPASGRAPHRPKTVTPVAATLIAARSLTPAGVPPE